MILYIVKNACALILCCYFWRN